MTTKTAGALLFDPWPNASTPAPEIARVWAAPVSWSAMPAPLRQIFGGCMVSVLAERKDAAQSAADALANIVWERSRAITFQHRGIASRVDLALRDMPELGDYVAIIADAIRRLLQVGDLLGTLRAARDRLDAQIASLEAMPG